MTGHELKTSDRRATLKAFARWGVFGLCVGTGGLLAARRGSFAKGRGCSGDGLCDKCELLRSCDLPRARSAKSASRE